MKLKYHPCFCLGQLGQTASIRTVDIPAEKVIFTNTLEAFLLEHLCLSRNETALVRKRQNAILTASRRAYCHR
jgi:hypothetical protein